jgi:hypothetical protein
MTGLKIDGSSASYDQTSLAFEEDGAVYLRIDIEVDGSRITHRYPLTQMETALYHHVTEMENSDLLRGFTWNHLRAPVLKHITERYPTNGSVDGL